jgi:hypothetical protein
MKKSMRDSDLLELQLERLCSSRWMAIYLCPFIKLSGCRVPCMATQGQMLLEDIEKRIKILN